MNTQKLNVVIEGEVTITENSYGYNFNLAVNVNVGGMPLKATGSSRNADSVNLYYRDADNKAFNIPAELVDLSQVIERFAMATKKYNSEAKLRAQIARRAEYKVINASVIRNMVVGLPGVAVGALMTEGVYEGLSYGNEISIDVEYSGKRFCELRCSKEGTSVYNVKTSRLGKPMTADRALERVMELYKDAVKAAEYKAESVKSANSWLEKIKDVFADRNLEIITGWKSSFSGRGYEVTSYKTQGIEFTPIGTTKEIVGAELKNIKCSLTAFNKIAAILAADEIANPKN